MDERKEKVVEHAYYRCVRCGAGYSSSPCPTTMLTAWPGVEFVIGCPACEGRGGTFPTAAVECSNE